MFPHLTEELRNQNSRDQEDFKRLEIWKIIHPVEIKFSMLFPFKGNCHLQSKAIIKMLFY